MDTTNGRREGRRWQKQQKAEGESTRQAKYKIAKGHEALRQGDEALRRQFDSSSFAASGASAAEQARLKAERARQAERQAAQQQAEQQAARQKRWATVRAKAANTRDSGAQAAQNGTAPRSATTKVFPMLVCGLAIITVATFTFSFFVNSENWLRRPHHLLGHLYRRNEAAELAAALNAASTPDPADDYSGAISGTNKWDAEREQAEARKKALKAAGAGGEAGAGGDEEQAEADNDDGGVAFARTLNEAARALARPLFFFFYPSSHCVRAFLYIYF